MIPSLIKMITLVFPKLLASLSCTGQICSKGESGLCSEGHFCLEESAELLQKQEDFCLKERSDKEGAGRKWTGDLKNRSVRHSFGLLGMVLGKPLRASFF